MIPIGIFSSTGGAPPPAAELIRTTAGLVAQEDFSSLAAWTLDAPWSGDDANPAMACWISPLPWLLRNGTTENSTLREGNVFVVSDDLMYFFYDTSADSSTPWAIFFSKSTDGGLTWTHLGPQTTLVYGGLNCNCAGPLIDGHDGFYYFYIQANNSFAGSVPANPYTTVTFKCAYADIEADNWVFVQHGPALVPSSYCENTLDSSCIVDINGTKRIWYSTRTDSTSGTAWTTGQGGFTGGLGSTPTIGASPDDAAAINNNTGTGSRPENPKVWFETPTSAWMKSVNCIDPTANFSYATDLYIVPGSENVDPTWSGSDSYRFRVLPDTLTTPFGAFLPMGILGPFLDLDLVVQKETDGNLGFVIDANISNSSTHLDRDFYQGQLENFPAALAVNDPVPGQNTTGYYATTPVSTTDCVAEFVLSYGQDNVPLQADIAFLYRHNGGGDTTGHGYVLNFSGEATPGIALYRQNTGFLSFQLIGSANTPPVFSRDLDDRNFQIHYIKIKVEGNVHTCWVDGIQMFSVTDDGTNGGVVASGTHIGFRSVGAIGKTRLLSVRAADEVTISGLTPGAAVALRGASRTAWDTGFADGGGSVTLSSYHFPMYAIEVDGVKYTPSDDGLIWGGDVFELVAPP